MADAAFDGGLNVRGKSNKFGGQANKGKFAADDDRFGGISPLSIKERFMVRLKVISNMPFMMSFLLSINNYQIGIALTIYKSRGRGKSRTKVRPPPSPPHPKNE